MKISRITTIALFFIAIIVLAIIIMNAFGLGNEIDWFDKPLSEMTIGQFLVILSIVVYIIYNK